MTLEKKVNIDYNLHTTYGGGVGGGGGGGHLINLCKSFFKMYEYGIRSELVCHVCAVKLEPQ